MITMEEFEKMADYEAGKLLRWASEYFSKYPDLLEKYVQQDDDAIKLSLTYLEHLKKGDKGSPEYIRDCKKLDLAIINIGLAIYEETTRGKA